MSYKALKRRLLSTWQGKAESSKMNFAFRIHDLMTEKEISNSQLAEKLDASRPYVSKLLRGDQNLSIESMHKIANSLDAEICIYLARKSSSVHWFEVLNKDVHKETIHPVRMSKVLKESKKASPVKQDALSELTGEAVCA